MEPLSVQGQLVPYMDEYIDGWQAFWARGADISNPYEDPVQAKWWSLGYENAKNTKEGEHTIGLNYELMVEQYNERHGS